VRTPHELECKLAALLHKVEQADQAEQTSRAAA
jgi:hypothetical protein